MVAKVFMLVESMAAPEASLELLHSSDSQVEVRECEVDALEFEVCEAASEKTEEVDEEAEEEREEAYG